MTKSCEPRRFPASPWLYTLVALAPLAGARAEPMFVIDKVVLSVYAEPNQEARKVATLETGDTVEKIDELDPYVRVRLTDGREGWVRANYLSKEPPAIFQLKVLQSEQGATRSDASPQLVQEIAELKKQNGELQNEVSRLQQQAAAAPPAPAVADAAEPAPAPQPSPLPAPPTTAQPMVFNMPWLSPVALVAGGAIGFLLGYQSLARRIRRRYGGVKIY